MSGGRIVLLPSRWWENTIKLWKTLKYPQHTSLAAWPGSAGTSVTSWISCTTTTRKSIACRAECAILAKKPRGERAAGIEAGRFISQQEEFTALINVCLVDNTYAVLRDRAMFALAYSTGPCVHEVAGLNVNDVTLVKGDELMYEVRIIGKGNKERSVKPVLVGGAAQYLHEWLLTRGNTKGALFCYITRPSKRSGAKGVISRKGTHLTTDALVKILEKRQLQADLEHLSWHDFRRTYISDLINQYDLVTAQKIIGHSSTNITAKYDRTWQDKAREAARMRVITYKSGNANENSG